MVDRAEPCYQRLNAKSREFRLLTIRGGSHGDEIHCRLRTASLGSSGTPHYETISYCWGDRRQGIPLTVNGHIILVPPNARDAIARLRLPDKDRVVWLDSVCINQTDLQERSSQVASMGLIYGKAAGNLIFLGQGHGVDTTAIAKIVHDQAERIRSARTQLSQNEEMGFMTGMAPSRWIIHAVVRNDEQSAMAPLYESLWFQRLWVVQEASLAKQNTCVWGESRFLLEDVLLNASINTRPAFFSPEATKGFFAAAAMRQFALPSVQNLALGGEHFLTYHPVMRTMATTDPRDRVFAVLDLYRTRAGLASIPRLLVPDYTKPVAAVFRDATRHALSEPASGGLLSSICHRSDADMTENGYTSWTRRFDRQFSPREDSLALRNAAATFPPDSIDHRLEMADSEDLDVLTLEGWVIGRLTWSSETAQSPQFQSLEYPTAKALVDSVFARCVTVASQQTFGMDDTYSLAADILTTGSLGGSTCQFNDRDSRSRAFKLYVEYLHERHAVPPAPDHGFADEDDNNASIAKFHRLLSNQTHRRRYFQLDRGHVGIGPAILREGDVVFICNGAEHPYVLRPHGSYYLFVGAAYIPGLMTGQVLHLGLEATWLHIR